MAKLTWLKIPEYAAHAGVSPEYIRKLIKSGKIPKKALKSNGSRKLVNPERADEALKNNISQIGNTKARKTAKTEPKRNHETEPKENQGESSDQPEEPDLEKKIETISAAGLMKASLAQAQTIKERYLAALKKLEYDEKSGTLVSVAAVEKEAFEVARLTRDSVLNVVDRVAAMLAAENNEKVVADILRDELMQALEAIAGD